MLRSFEKFEDIENELAIEAPKVVYKYRKWTDANHKTLLSDQLAWFAHPFDLNDPLDVRPETIFNPDEINDPRYLKRLIEAATHMNTERERRIVGERRLEELKANPNLIIINYKNRNTQRKNFDRYGVFSTAIDDLNETIWKEYAENYSGYCLGFDTIEMCRQMKSGFGYVTYSDSPYQYNFLDKRDDGLDIMYLKKEKWQPENEFRFITVGIGIYSERLQQFTPETASELIIGYNIPLDKKEEILDIVKNKYNLNFPFLI